MHKSSLATRRFLLAAAVASAVSLVTVHAATLAWDPGSTPSGGATPAGSGGTGTWLTSNWSNGASDQLWVDGSDAIFGGTAGTVSLGGNITTGNITLNTSSYTLSGTSAQTLTINGVVTVNSGGACTISARVGGTDFTKAGSGTLVLFNPAANTYTGTTFIQNGVITTRSASALPAATTVILGNGTNSGGLDVRASQTVSGIGTSGTGTNNRIIGDTSNAAGTTTTLTVNSDGATTPADSTFSGAIRDGDATHFLALTKAGSRTLTLSGSNTYTGATNINGGTLLLNTSLTGTAGVNLAGGTLSGNNSLGDLTLGTLGLSMTTGSITPGGNGTAGSFTIAANQSFVTSGGTLAFDLVSTVSFDQIKSSGTSVFSLSNTTLSLSGLTATAGTYQIFTGFGGTNSVSNLTINGLSGGYTGSLSTSGVLTIAAIPEPSTYALFLGGAALGALVLRRRNATARLHVG